MIDFILLTNIIIGILILLVLILRVKLPAFIALLIASIITGLLAGLESDEIVNTITDGMGGTLGFVATVVGLGAIFGGILEHSGGANAIANYLMQRMGMNRAPLAIMISGFIIAIPVFFDVAFIILIPVIYAIQRKTKKSLLLYAIPLLAGLAATHAFIPPTPGPIAVAELVDADMGWVILIGFMAGLPAVLVSGLFFGKYIASKIHIEAPIEILRNVTKELPDARLIFAIIVIPIVLILLNTFVSSNLIGVPNEYIKNSIQLIGHPFVALIIANLIAWYSLGILRGIKNHEMLKISAKSFEPAGTIILLTGAGGVFKQVLINTGAGKMLATSLIEIEFPILVFGFLTAAIVRIVQGSATVAMITAAGLVAPLLHGTDLYGASLACLVIAIASGASIFSHVNDSGFWLVGQYLHLTEKQTFKTWSVMTTLLALTGFLMVLLINSFL
ncbi:gluconate:H+ symporter [Ascidiimonas sp. W6]|uniref:GntP family permease n=1 Tax=Ascidiimonas meishanensis TaxID=3128903 RepID=UPI0030ED4D37